MPTFAGFTDQALELYAGLADDNSRSYWADHKAVYDHEVRAPMTLSAALATFVGPTTGIGHYVALDASGLVAGGGWRAHAPGQDAGRGPLGLASRPTARGLGRRARGDRLALAVAEEVSAPGA